MRILIQGTLMGSIVGLCTLIVALMVVLEVAITLHAIIVPQVPILIVVLLPCVKVDQLRQHF